MGLTARRSLRWRARSRNAVAVAVLSAWFGSLLVAAPFATPAFAAPADPVTEITVAGPASPDNDTTPAWTFTLPADDPGTPSVPALVDPLDPASDTATVTISTTHRGRCYVGATPPTQPSDYVACSASTGNPNEYTFTSPALTVEDDYTFYVHDAETSTTTTTVHHADGTSTVQPSTSTPAVEGNDKASAPYRLDLTGPTLTVTRTPTSPGTSPTPTWTIAAGADADSVACSFTDGTTTTTPACSTSYSPTLTADGTYTLTVTATDVYGNETVKTSPYTLQSAAAPGVSVSPSTGLGTTPTWTLTPPAGTTPTAYSVTLSAPGGPAGAPVVVPADPTTYAGSYPSDLTPAADGTWTLSATATVDGRASAAGSATYVLDTTDPVVTILPASSSAAKADPTPGWQVTVVDDTATTVTCAVTPTPTPDPGSDCAAYVTWTAPAEGDYTLTATATDAASNTGSASSLYRYNVPPTAPDIVTPPTGNGPTVTWRVSTPLGTTVTCGVTGTDGFTDTPTCSQGTNVAVTVLLPAGPALVAQYVLRVTATDPGGSTATDSTPYLLDRMPPGIPTFGAGSTGSQNVAGISWPYTASGGTVTCRLVQQGPTAEVVGAAETPCPASPYARNLPNPGEWWVRVSVTDAAGNTSSNDSAHVIYDATNPDAPSLSRTSSSPTSVRDTTWTIGTTETVGATLLCSWTGPGFSDPEVACPASYAYPLPTTNGTYTLTVVVRDAAGNRSTATTGTVVFDNAAPIVTFGTPPASPRKNTTLTWTTTVNEPSAKTECQLTKRATAGDTVIEAWTTTDCGRTVTRTLGNGDGIYVLQVRDTDAAGNVAADGTASDDVVLDTTAPGAPTVSGSSGYSQNTAAAWTVTPPAGPVDSTTTYLCRLVKDNNAASATWVACDTDLSTPGVTFTVTLSLDGAYRLDVQATDPAGNLSTPIASSATYTLDRVPPPAPTVSTPSYESFDDRPVWTITGEVGATFACTWTTTISPGPTGMPANGACMNNYQVRLPAEGLYTLHVTQTDRAANTSTTSTDKNYLLDKTAPAEPVVTGPTGPAKTTTFSYTFTSDARTTAECRMTYVAGLSADPPAPIGLGTWTTCSSPWTVTLVSGDGRYRAEVRLTDVAKNVSTVGQSPIYVLDTAGPAAPTFLTEPLDTANAKVVTWTWTGETPSTGTCTLSRTAPGSTTPAVVAGPTPCNGETYTTTLTFGDGFYQLAVRLTDPSLNAGAIARSTGYTLDATPPGAPTVTGPTGPSNRATVDYSIGAVEALARVECRLTRDSVVVVGSDWATCTLPRTITLVGDGTYVLEVRLTDRYGNLGPVGASQPYLLDTKLPTVPVVTAPASPSANGGPVFGIVSDADTRTTCRLSRGSVVAVDNSPCSGSFTTSLVGLPDGDYVLTVTATDPAGNVATGASSAYTYDTTKPVAPVVSGPSGPSQTRNPAFTWTGEAGTNPQCSLQEKAGSPSAWVPCGTPYAPALPADGSWVLSVRLVDAAGNVGDPGLSGAYVLDTTAPPTPVVTAPTSPGRDLAPSWSAGTEEGSRIECRLIGPGQLAAWGPCTLPVTTPLTTDGGYTFEVRATDAAGNVSPVGSGNYILDTVAPGAPVVVQPASPGRSRTPAVSFTSEPGTTGSCRLTHGTTVLSESAPCGSPTTMYLDGAPDGAYTLSVRAVDAAGNIGPASTATYVLDTTAPATPVFTLVAGSPSSDRAPAFGFIGDLGTTLGCKLTSPSGLVRDLACASPLTLDLSGAGDGDYLLSVRATDPAGNTGLAASTTYRLDSSAPAAPRVVGPPTPGTNRNPVWRITSSSPAECRLTRSPTVIKDWVPCGTSYAADLFTQPDGAYVLEARVIGTTAPTSSRYRLDTVGPAAAVLVGPPSPSTDRRPTWAVSSADTTVHAECMVMIFTGILRDWAPCAVSPAGALYTLDLSGLGDGTYSLVVRLTDAAGNLGPNATSDYVLDTSAPAAVGVIAPLSPGNDPTPTWTLTSAAGVKLECRVSSGQTVISDFAPCAGTFTADLTGLPDGTYTLTVHAVSAAGTPGPETTSSYILDTTAAGAPGTLSGPTGPSRDRAPKWTFTLAPGTTALCKVTFLGKVFREGACTSPYVLDLSNAADGTYTLTVRAVDAAGNLGSPSTAGYILKTTPPPPPVLTMLPGSPSSTTDPRWGFSLFRGTTAQCRLLQGSVALEDWTACSASGASGGTVTALLSGKPDGLYTMQVRAIDVALNTSAAVSGDYTFDRSAAPLALFIDTPPTPGNDLTPTWVVAAPPAGPVGTAALVRAASLVGTPLTECRLTTPRGVGGWAPCSGRYVATTNGDGTYLLEVRAFDSAGQRGPASSSAYLLDTRAPVMPRFTEPIPPAVGNDAEVAWSWNEDDNLVQCHLLRNGSSLSGFTTCTPPFVATFARLGEATYTIEARAVDAAGNVSPVASASYRYDVTPPPAPSFVMRPPSRGSSSSVGWTFAVPVDTRAVCVVSRNGTVISEGACAGAFTLDLRGQQPATWTLSVHLVDSAGNIGPSTVGSYTLVTALGRGRVDGPAGPGAAGPPTTLGTGSGLTPPGGGISPAGHSSGRDALSDPRAGAARIPAVIKKGIKAVARATSAIPGAVPGTDVPNAVKNVLKQTITKPQLPLVLFVIVLLFLLVQNRIDRRDPKLASAPVSAEPELTFGPILRPGGASV